MAAKFGANGGTDAFVNAFTVPDLTNYLVAGGALSISLLPLYSEYLARGDEREANRLLARIATFVLTVTLILVIVGEIFTNEIVRGLFHKMDPVALAACVRYTHILFPAQLFFVLGALISTTLYARGRFRAAAFAPLLYNVFIILGGFLLGDRLGVEALAWGALAGAIIGPFGIIILAAYRAGVRFHFEFNVRHPSFRAWLWQTLPLMIGVSLVTADDWILRYFGSDLAGQVTHLNYAKRLVAVPIAVVGQAVGQAAMPFLARLFAEGDLKKFADTLSRTLRSTGVIAVVLSAMMMTAAEPLVVVLFQRHKFTHDDSVATAQFLAIFAAAIPLWAWQGLVSRAFYSTDVRVAVRHLRRPWPRVWFRCWHFPAHCRDLRADSAFRADHESRDCAAAMGAGSRDRRRRGHRCCWPRNSHAHQRYVQRNGRHPRRHRPARHGWRG